MIDTKTFAQVNPKKSNLLPTTLDLLEEKVMNPKARKQMTVTNPKFLRSSPKILSDKE
jgi:hypothetical protein